MKRTVMQNIDDFCDRHPNFGFSNLMMYIVAGNIAVYILAMMDTTGMFLLNLSFDYNMIMKGQIWRLITFIFVPSTSSLFSFALSLYFYYFIGNILEKVWGTAKFNLYYLFGVILSAAYGMIVGALMNVGYIGITSFYINMAMFFAYATFYPDNIVLFFFVIPMKIKYLAYIDAAMFAITIFFNPFPFNLLPIIAILNYLIFCYSELSYYISRNRRNHSTARAARSVKFHQAAKKAARADENKPYRHKCAVCGRTDTDYPELQFRYCSRCEGYHCFCEDHINNHIHFTE